MRMLHCLVASFASALVVSTLSTAQVSSAPETGASVPVEPVATRHVISLEGRQLEYLATAGFLPISEESGKQVAEMFFVAYTLADEEGVSRRPVTFAFNGGPGAAAIWLHMGAMAPVRAPLAQDGLGLRATAKLEPNDQTWLPFTDMVFVDPISTGYSRVVEGVEAERFYKPEEDVRAAGAFIRLYATRYGRWQSPKYVLGESYGAARGAALCEHLQERLGMHLNGAIFVSSAVNFQTLLLQSGNELPFALAVPTFAATAWYHKRLPAPQGSLEDVLRDAERWALEAYLPALARGDALDAAERRRVAERLARYTALSVERVEESNLRVSTFQFAREFPRDAQRVVGMMDSRVAGFSTAAGAGQDYTDPSLFLAAGPFVAAFNHYVRRDLGFETDRNYEFLNPSVNRAWQWGDGQGFMNTTRSLRRAMALNSSLRVLVVGGYYDLTTPYFGQVYSFTHLHLPPELRGNISLSLYHSGHQLYTSRGALVQFREDGASFITRDSGVKGAGDE